MDTKSAYLVLLLTAFTGTTVLCQPFFSEKTRQFKSSISTRSVMPGASLDINGDLVDDIIVIDRGLTLKTILSSGKHFELIPGNSIRTTILREWSLAAGDLNNDGLIEIITTGAYSQGSITTLNSSGQLTKKNLTTNVYAQGSAVVDINNDGWLDYFLCNEDGPPKIYLNDKTGSLRLNEVIDFLENDDTDGSGNYGVVWTDINGDYLTDMVLSKCKAGVNDPADKRRINRLYISNGDGSYTESGTAFNLNSGAQTWVTVVEDFDNDGDMDALVVNHYSPHQLMENINNERFEESQLPEVLSSFSFQAVSLDIDNDGLIDILLSGAESGILLHNKGNMQFEIIKDIFGKFTVHSFTTGDYNDDGFPDIHAHLGLPINEVGLSDDQLWLNNSNDNHYLKISLRGTTSNLSGIGAHLSLYTPAGRQVRMVKGGESYGICNSLQQTFGLGASTDIDSLVIRWPSGIKETYTDLQADNTYLAQESLCISQQIALYDEVQIYKNEPLSIEAPAGYTGYLWNNGSKSPAVSVNPGVYHVSMTDANGCMTISKPVKVVSGCFSANTDILKDDYLSFCAGTSLEILASVNGSTFLWQDSIIGSSFISDETGWVTILAQDYCGQTIRDSVFVERLALDIDFEITADTIRKGQQATLASSDSSTNWYRSPDFDRPVYSGSTFISEPLYTTTIFGARAVALLDYKTAVTGEHEMPASNQYHTNTASGTIIFSIESGCVLHKVTVNTDTPGTRRIYILKNNKDTVFAQNFMLPIGISALTLDATLLPGDYVMGTDEKVNQANLGFKSPRLVRTSGNTAYPYTIDDVITIKTSSFGPTAYLYFYDFELYTDLLYCESDLKTITVQVDTTTSLKDYRDIRVKLSPNPVTDWLYMSSETPVDEVILTNLYSQYNLNISYTENAFNMQHLPAGIYLLTVRKGHKTKHFKVVKM